MIYHNVCIKELGEIEKVIEGFYLDKGITDLKVPVYVVKSLDEKNETREYVGDDAIGRMRNIRITTVKGVKGIYGDLVIGKLDEPIEAMVNHFIGNLLTKPSSYFFTVVGGLSWDCTYMSTVSRIDIINSDLLMPKDKYLGEVK